MLHLRVINNVHKRALLYVKGRELINIFVTLGSKENNENEFVWRQIYWFCVFNISIVKGEKNLMSTLKCMHPFTIDSYQPIRAITK